MNKRILSILCVLSLIIVSMATPRVQATEIQPIENNLVQDLINEVLRKDSQGFMGANATLVLNNNDVSQVRQIGVNATVTDGNVVSVVTDGEYVRYAVAIPMKLNSNGELINSFSYIAQLDPETISTMGYVATELYDVIVYTSCQYTRYINDANYYFYRPESVFAYWVSASGSAISMLSSEVRFSVLGRLIAYPDCMNTTSYNTLMNLVVDSDYTYNAVISSMPYENSRVAGISYLASNRAIWCASYYEHGGSVGVYVRYSINGTTKEYSKSHMVFLGA